MGCDGGTIPTRDELVKTKKRPEQKDRDAQRLFQWRHCHLTQEPLAKPIVACGLGRLYNKEAVIKKMLDDKKKAEKEIDAKHAHVRSLKDIRELQLTANPAFNGQNPSVGDGYVDQLVSPWICPVTGLEMNGRFRFVFDWSDGRVLSERAYKMVRKEPEAMLEENVVLMNPEENGEDEDRMRVKMEGRKARAKAGKKRKASSTATSEASEKPSTSKKTTKDAEKTTSSSSSSSSSLQNDPKKSEVFKSLFDSHPSAQNRPKGNWVTFDPRYN